MGSGRKIRSEPPHISCAQRRGWLPLLNFERLSPIVWSGGTAGFSDPRSVAADFAIPGRQTTYRLPSRSRSFRSGSGPTFSAGRCEIAVSRARRGSARRGRLECILFLTAANGSHRAYFQIAEVGKIHDVIQGRAEQSFLQLFDGQIFAERFQPGNIGVPIEASSGNASAQCFLAHREHASDFGIVVLEGHGAPFRRLHGGPDNDFTLHNRVCRAVNGVLIVPKKTRSMLSFLLGTRDASKAPATFIPGRGFGAPPAAAAPGTHRFGRSQSCPGCVRSQS